MAKKIVQTVLLSCRYSSKSIGALHQDEISKGTRLRVYLSGKLLGGVVFQNSSETAYYFAMQRLSKKIKRPIQYIVIFYPSLPLNER